jgi:hypothetical protein
VEVLPESGGAAIPLPDIKQALRKKEMEEEQARIEEEEEETKVRIKRTDKKAMARVSIIVWFILTLYWSRMNLAN